MSIPLYGNEEKGLAGSLDSLLFTLCMTQHDFLLCFVSLPLGKKQSIPLPMKMMPLESFEHLVYSFNQIGQTLCIMKTYF